MDFFAAQDQSRRQTRRLILLYALAVFAVVIAVTAILSSAWYWLTVQSGGAQRITDWAAARGHVFAVIATGTLGLIAAAGLFRMLNLRGGGARVARELGGTEVAADTRDLLRRRLRNIVEEMAIASGVAVPQVFVLEREAGVNAFAAGYRPEDAVVAVTRGALEQLDRDELQGVIAHEFSHILNGDMRLNIRMLGPLFGIMVIGHIGRLVLRSVGRGRTTSRRSSGAPVVLIVSIGLIAVGFVGVLGARLIRASVSRQREFLADASAVQFTRQPDGIAGALKRIAAGSQGSRVESVDVEEVSHMLFAPGATIARLFATHPPLLDRISRLDPAFDAGQLKSVGTAAPTDTGDTVTVAALSAGAEIPAAQTRFPLVPEAVVAHVGETGASEVSVAHVLHRNIPAELYEAVHADREAPLLVLGLMLHPDAEPRSAQLSFLVQQLGPERASKVEDYATTVAELGPQYRLPLLDMAFPALRNRPLSEIDYFRDLLRKLVDADGAIELFEYCLSRILDGALDRVAAPDLRTRRLRHPVTAPRFRAAINTVFGTLAGRGHDRSDVAVTALRAGLEKLEPGLAPAVDEALGLVRPRDGWQSRLDRALADLRQLAPAEQRRLIAALTVTAATDGSITVAESELLRVFCAVLECPLPPLYADFSQAQS
ncbi:MAG: M48 family metallopeptidase [Gammaproteobacteria bacterium]|nr:M48 family metallopeptidase [Gammaproteobacteria bacterium]